MDVNDNDKFEDSDSESDDKEDGEDSTIDLGETMVKKGNSRATSTPISRPITTCAQVLPRKENTAKDKFPKEKQCR